MSKKSLSCKQRKLTVWCGGLYLTHSTRPFGDEVAQVSVISGRSYKGVNASLHAS